MYQEEPTELKEDYITEKGLSIFDALAANEIGTREYTEMVQYLIDENLAFFLGNSYRSLMYADGTA